jgi:Na+/H+ antiporter NhaA
VESNQNTRKSENRILHELESDMHFAQTPVEKLELALAPFSAFFIMPVSV